MCRIGIPEPTVTKIANHHNRRGLTVYRQQYVSLRETGDE